MKRVFKELVDSDLVYLSLMHSLPKRCVKDICKSGSNDAATLFLAQRLKLSVCPEFSARKRKSYGLDPSNYFLVDIKYSTSSCFVPGEGIDFWYSAMMIYEVTEEKEE